jgi:hypothetical protein
MARHGDQRLGQLRGRQIGVPPLPLARRHGDFQVRRTSSRVTGSSVCEIFGYSAAGMKCGCPTLPATIGRQMSRWRLAPERS